MKNLFTDEIKQRIKDYNFIEYYYNEVIKDFMDNLQKRDKRAIFFSYQSLYLHGHKLLNKNEFNQFKIIISWLNDKVNFYPDINTDLREYDTELDSDYDPNFDFDCEYELFLNLSRYLNTDIKRAYNYFKIPQEDVLETFQIIIDNMIEDEIK